MVGTQLHMFNREYCVIAGCTEAYSQILHCGDKRIKMCYAHFRQWRKCSQPILNQEFTPHV